jgi:hypothetical protein
MKKPKKGKPRRPRGSRKKSPGRKRKSLNQHILYCRRWSRNFSVAKERILLDLAGEPDDKGFWEVDACTGDAGDNLLVETKVRATLLGILENHESL